MDRRSHFFLFLFSLIPHNNNNTELVLMCYLTNLDESLVKTKSTIKPGVRGNKVGKRPQNWITNITVLTAQGGKNCKSIPCVLLLLALILCFKSSFSLNMFSSLSSTCKSLPLGPWDLTCIIYITRGYKVIAVHSFFNGETHRTAKVGFVL